MSHTCCTRQTVKRGLWSPEEDQKLFDYVSTHGHGCWSNVPNLAGLQRCGKSCRLRWINYLRPDLKRGYITTQEAALIIELHRLLGNRWSQIAKHLPGRTDNEIKNFWNTSIKKKLPQLYASTSNPQMENPRTQNSAPEYQGFDPDMLLMPTPANPPPSGSWPVNSHNNNNLLPDSQMDPPVNLMPQPDESVIPGIPPLIMPMYIQDSTMFDTLLPETSKMMEFGMFSPPPPPVLDPLLPINHIKNIEALMTSFAKPPPSGFSSTGFPSSSWGYY